MTESNFREPSNQFIIEVPVSLQHYQILQLYRYLNLHYLGDVNANHMVDGQLVPSYPEKETEEFLTGYKVTFCVKFNPENHQESDICDPESFGQWLCDFIPGEIIRSFNFMGPEDVSSFEVVEMDEDDKKYWKFW